ncbi:hypothetical protein [Kineobactrum salinum]|uniref:DUF2846 domain-containing protein n=1 Tax=Kineobactrum salinum TaxID=2708301 RepID=A0A6C0TZ99_9GAMM|nr:hypothetical protein [Kineobactrum salinum]QIB65152.1 hypothetical protein G3T16_06775 [Kineobactrum salinum]
MSSYSSPTTGFAGIYYYHPKSTMSAVADFGIRWHIPFKINGEVAAIVGPNQWTYFEIPAGTHEYHVTNDLFPTKTNIDLLEGGNYFFLGSLIGLAFSLDRTPMVIHLVEQDKIDEVISMMASGELKRIAHDTGRDDENQEVDAAPE